MEGEMTGRILRAAGEEFLSKGFMDTSMRTIAAKVGITATALYRHFQDKEAIFEALVFPAMRFDSSDYVSRRDDLFQVLVEEGPDAMWQKEVGSYGELADHVYQHYDAYKLLVCCAAGTKYENYIHDLSDQLQKDTFYFMDVVKAKGVPVKEVDPVEFHLLISAQYSAFFEIVRHDFSYEKAKHYAKVLEDFFQPGWRKLLGF